MQDFRDLKTEGRNLGTVSIDKMDSLEIIRTINNEDKTVAHAVEQALPDIARGVDCLAAVLQSGGRIFYAGAGTSGRLGVLDASECPPTYGVSAETVQGLLAGGHDAMFESIEDAEDDFDSIAKQMREKDFCVKDVLVAISASGSANCVKGAISLAREHGATVLCVTCNKNSGLVPLSDIAMVAEVGPEVISGSTRMKAGTAQKMILNMLSTGAFIRIGRTRGNYMAYMVPSNDKLKDRAIRIICDYTGTTPEIAARELAKANDIIADAIDTIVAG